MLRSLALALSSLTLGVAIAAPASSQTITETIQFSGLFPADNPFANPVTGSFTLSFVNGVSSQPAVTVNSLSVPYDGVIQAQYAAAVNLLYIGASPNGLYLTGGGANDFLFSLENPTVDGVGTFQFTTRAGYNSLFESVAVKVTAVPSVPEPAAWAMMILGLGAVGYAMRRRVRASEVRFNAEIKQISETSAA